MTNPKVDSTFHYICCLLNASDAKVYQVVFYKTNKCVIYMMISTAKDLQKPGKVFEAL